MKVYRGLNEFNKLENAVVTNGTFDGVHIGHQKILSRLKESAKATHGETVVLTFWPHPRFVLQPNDHNLELLSSLDEKIELLDRLHIDHLLIIPFSKSFAETSPDEYIQRVLIDTIGTKQLIIGYDHKFGRHGKGSFTYLQENSHRFGFEVEEIARQDIENVGISSTKIRKSLHSGDIATANKYLGREYELSGTVITGDQLGRQIGFPTANIHIDETLKLVPSNGVYTVRIKAGDFSGAGMINIGTRPTVDGTKKTIEANIFDFAGDLYDKKIEVSFIEKIRSEIKFEDIDQLKNQLIKDKEVSLKIINRIES